MTNDREMTDTRNSKQFLRNYLTENGLKGKPNVTVPEEILTATSERYQDVFERLVGKKLQDVIKA